MSSTHVFVFSGFMFDYQVLIHRKLGLSLYLVVALSLMFSMQMICLSFVEGILIPFGICNLFLDNYGAAYGQLVNKDKSTFYLGASHFHRQHQVKKILGFKLGTSPFSYLG